LPETNSAIALDPIFGAFMAVVEPSDDALEMPIKNATAIRLDGVYMCDTLELTACLNSTRFTIHISVPIREVFRGSAFKTQIPVRG
jgi:hypothetical protein